jgi:hypothetical protein
VVVAAVAAALAVALTMVMLMVVIMRCGVIYQLNEICIEEPVRLWLACRQQLRTRSDETASA